MSTAIMSQNAMYEFGENLMKSGVNTDGPLAVGSSMRLTLTRMTSTPIRPPGRPQRHHRQHFPLQDRAVSTVRRVRRVQVWRQVPVRARHARAAQPGPPSQVQNRAVQNLSHGGILPLRTALSFRPQPRGGDAAERSFAVLQRCYGCAEATSVSSQSCAVAG